MRKLFNRHYKVALEININTCFFSEAPPDIYVYLHRLFRGGMNAFTLQLELYK